MVLIPDTAFYRSPPVPVAKQQDLHATLKDILSRSLEENIKVWKSSGGMPDLAVRKAVPTFGSGATITGDVADYFQRYRFEVTYNIVMDRGFVSTISGDWKYPSQEKNI